MKVKLTNKVSSFLYLNRDYKPGDVFEVPKNLFHEEFMVEIKQKTPPKPVQNPKVSKRKKAKKVTSVTEVLPKETEVDMQ